MIRLTKRYVRYRGGRAPGVGRNDCFARSGDDSTPWPEKGAGLRQQLAVAHRAGDGASSRRGTYDTPLLRSREAPVQGWRLPIPTWTRVTACIGANGFAATAIGSDRAGAVSAR